MPNPTVRREREINRNEDGSVVEIFRSIRENGDASEMIFFREGNRIKRVIWHVVYDATGVMVHGPHEKYRRPGDETIWPPPGY
jgi:hypothetical protein